MNFSKLVRTISRTASVKSPTILIGMAGVGVVVTTVMAVCSTIKSMDDIAEEEERRFQEERDLKGEQLELTKKEVVALCWSNYIPPIIMAILTIICMICSHNINLRRNAALATAYSLSERTLSSITAKSIETIGEKKTRQIRDEVIQDHILANPPTDDNIILTGKGMTLFYEPTQGRYFRSDIEAVRRALTNVKDDQLSDPFNMRVSLQDVYYALLIPDTCIGSTLGWDYHKDGAFDYDLRSAILKPDGSEAAIAIEYINPPQAFERLRNR